MSSVIPDSLFSIVADVLEVQREQINSDSSPETIETWDSLRHLNLVIALEQEFGVQFEVDEIEQLLSVELIAAMVKRKQGGNGTK